MGEVCSRQGNITQESCFCFFYPLFCAFARRFFFGVSLAALTLPRPRPTGRPDPQTPNKETRQPGGGAALRALGKISGGSGLGARTPQAPQPAPASHRRPSFLKAVARRRDCGERDHSSPRAGRPEGRVHDSLRSAHRTRSLAWATSRRGR